jgi:hypothetical protein
MNPITERGLAVPQINLNGTDGAELIEEAQAAHEAVHRAVEMVGRMTVHGRDFQTCVGPNTVFSLACDQKRERLRKLLDVRSELFDLVLELSLQQKDR